MNSNFKSLTREQKIEKWKDATERIQIAESKLQNKGYNFTSMAKPIPQKFNEDTFNKYTNIYSDDVYNNPSIKGGKGHKNISYNEAQQLEKENGFDSLSPYRTNNSIYPNEVQESDISTSTIPVNDDVFWDTYSRITDNIPSGKYMPMKGIKGFGYTDFESIKQVMIDVLNETALDWQENGQDYNKYLKDNADKINDYIDQLATASNEDQVSNSYSHLLEILKGGQLTNSDRETAHFMSESQSRDYGDLDE